MVKSLKDYFDSKNERDREAEKGKSRLKQASSYSETIPNAFQMGSKASCHHFMNGEE